MKTDDFPRFSRRIYEIPGTEVLCVPFNGPEMLARMKTMSNYSHGRQVHMRSYPELICQKYFLLRSAIACNGEIFNFCIKIELHRQESNETIFEQTKFKIETFQINPPVWTTQMRHQRDVCVQYHVCSSFFEFAPTSIWVGYYLAICKNDCLKTNQNWWIKVIIDLSLGFVRWMLPNSNNLPRMSDCLRNFRRSLIVTRVICNHRDWHHVVSSDFKCHSGHSYSCHAIHLRVDTSFEWALTVIKPFILLSYLRWCGPSQRNIIVGKLFVGKLLQFPFVPIPFKRTITINFCIFRMNQMRIKNILREFVSFCIPLSRYWKSFCWLRFGDE